MFPNLEENKMSDNVKTYQINFSVLAKDFDDAIQKAKAYLNANPKKVIKEIGDKEKYKFEVVNK